MNKTEVIALFTQGVDLFQSNQEQPPIIDIKSRIIFMGWKAAKKAKQEIDEGLETAIEAFAELKRG